MSDEDVKDDELDIDGEGGFEEDFGDLDDFDTGEGAARDNPVAKFAVIGGGLALVVVGFLLFGGGGEEEVKSRVKGGFGEKVTQAPGMEEVSEDYEGRIREADRSRMEEARKAGESAIPTPLSVPESRLGLGDDASSGEEDPLERWRRIQEERREREEALKMQGKKDNTEEIARRNEAVDALAGAMSQQMEGILEEVELGEMVWIDVGDVDDYLKDKEERAENEKGSGGNESGDETFYNIILPAGTIEYAQALTESNSDLEDGPVLIELLSGPLKGNRLIGSFELVEDAELLVLTFDTIVIDGISYETEAVAIDPDVAVPGLASEVDHRYFKRVILPAAAAFVEGMGEAISEAGSTSVTVDNGAAVSAEEDLDSTQEFYKGLSAAAEVVGEILTDEADKTRILVRVEAGTPMGIVFLQPVAEES